MASLKIEVDPDPGVLGRPWLDDGHQMLVEEYAPEAQERFEVALCLYVIEHVEAPGPFLEAVRLQGLENEWRVVEGDTVGLVALHARYTDLTVLGQPNSDEAFKGPSADAVLVNVMACAP